MGLFGFFNNSDNNNERDSKLEKEMDKYDLNEEEREQVRKGYYQPDEFDRDDDEERDED